VVVRPVIIPSGDPRTLFEEPLSEALPRFAEGGPSQDHDAGR